MTWGEILAKADIYLSSKGVPEARVAAELLAARLLRLGRGLLAGEMEKSVPEKYLEAMRRGMKRLVDGEPLQYVLGEWDFRTLTLKCDRRALIPRPETEELVTRVLKWLSSRVGCQDEGVLATKTGGRVGCPDEGVLATKTGGRVGCPDEGVLATKPFIVDVGTGTGAIVLSLAKEFKGEAMFLGTDVSEDAIALAKENAAKCGLGARVKFAVADGLDDFDEPGIVDVIVSNPPYIETATCETLDPRVRDWEPRLALDGGASGLDFYDRYLGDALNILKPGGAIFFEIGENQGEALRKLMFDYGFENITVEKDFGGHDRYASATLP